MEKSLLAGLAFGVVTTLLVQFVAAILKARRAEAAPEDRAKVWKLASWGAPVAIGVVIVLANSVNQPTELPFTAADQLALLTTDDLSRGLGGRFQPSPPGKRFLRRSVVLEFSYENRVTDFSL